MPSASGSVCACAIWRGTDGSDGGRSDDHADPVLGTELRGPDGHGRVPGGRTAAHHRGFRRMPQLHDEGVRARVPGQAVRAHLRWRGAVQLRAVLRVRHLLPGMQHRGSAYLELPRGRARRRVQEVMMSGPGFIAAALKWVDLRPDVDPLAGTVRHDDRSAGFSLADAAALEWQLPVTAITAGPPGAQAVLRDAAAFGPLRLLLVTADRDAPSEEIADALAPLLDG